VGVGKTFRRFDPDQILLMPPSLNEWLPEDHLARFVAELVDQVLDLSGIYTDYREVRGYPPYDPRLMLRLLIYGYTTGVRSSRAIERKCTDDVAFRFLAADQAPDFRSIARFRRRHLDALADLLVQSLRLAQQLGMVKLGRVALDGTKLRANASRHKAMSYDRLADREAAVEAELAELEERAAAMLSDAEAVDEAEDARYGPDGKDGDLPAELARREQRLARLQAARAAIEAEAAERARAKAENAERRRQQRAGTDDPHAVAAAGDAAAEQAVPEPRAQRNFTDPESRIMKNSDGAFVQAYNAQAVVDEAHQIITAADISDCAAPTSAATPRCSTKAWPTPAPTPSRPWSTPATAARPTWPPPPSGWPSTAPTP
jgi:transposase